MNESIVRKIVEETSKKILEEIVISRKEVKSVIDACESRLLMKIEDQSKKLKELEQENFKLKQKLDILKKKDRNNNIVIFGLRRPTSDLDINFICSEVKRLVDVDLNVNDINNYFTLGKKESAPLKLELVSYLKKKSIFKNCKRLKGTGIAISEDLTPSQRGEYKNLLPYLTHYRKSGKYTKCYIKGAKLVLDNKRFTLEELLDAEEESTSISEPSTPTLTKAIPIDISQKQNIFVSQQISTEIENKKLTITPKSSKATDTTKKPMEKQIITRSTLHR